MIYVISGFIGILVFFIASYTIYAMALGMFKGFLETLREQIILTAKELNKINKEHSDQ